MGKSIIQLGLNLASFPGPSKNLDQLRTRIPLPPQIPTGTTEVKRTTVPLMYSLDDSIDSLDVVDFPGVDDRDESISDLADLLLTLAQIVIFVVDYRYGHHDYTIMYVTAEFL